jgi:hypothetical protein
MLIYISRGKIKTSYINGSRHISDDVGFGWSLGPTLVFSFSLYNHIMYFNEMIFMMITIL